MNEWESEGPIIILLPALIESSPSSSAERHCQRLEMSDIRKRTNTRSLLRPLASDISNQWRSPIKTTCRDDRWDCFLFNCKKKIIVYYVPRQSSWCLYEDAEFNVRAEGEDSKTASEYKQLDCLGAYDTLSEIRKRKREFVCRGAEFKLRLIVLRTCTCGVISHLYRNKVDVAERG